MFWVIYPDFWLSWQVCGSEWAQLDLNHRIGRYDIPGNSLHLNEVSKSVQNVIAHVISWFPLVTSTQELLWYRYLRPSFRVQLTPNDARWSSHYNLSRSGVVLNLTSLLTTMPVLSVLCKHPGFNPCTFVWPAHLPVVISWVQHCLMSAFWSSFSHPKCPTVKRSARALLLISHANDAQCFVHFPLWCPLWWLVPLTSGYTTLPVSVIPSPALP